VVLAYLPSPSQGVWHLGPLPIRAYALCIIAGIIVALIMTQRRWTTRGGDPEAILDVALWAVPFGVIGGRLYHLITDPELYFTAGKDPIKALYIWDGGLGIWGAVALGAVGAWIGCRRRGISLLAFGDALAPGLIVAQAIGRWGNYFNQELYGSPTTLPWALAIDPAHRPAATRASGSTTPRSSTNASGTSPSHCCCSGSITGSRWPAASFSPSTSPPTPWAVAGSRHCGSITPTTSSGCASTTGPR